MSLVKEMLAQIEEEQKKKLEQIEIMEREKRYFQPYKQCRNQNMRRNSFSFEILLKTLVTSKHQNFIFFFHNKNELASRFIMFKLFKKHFFWL